MVKTSSFQCRGRGFDPSSGELRSHMPRSTEKKKKDRVGNKPEDTAEENVVEAHGQQFSKPKCSVPGLERGENPGLLSPNTGEMRGPVYPRVPRPPQDLLEVDRGAAFPWDRDLQPWRAPGSAREGQPPSVRGQPCSP